MALDGTIDTDVQDNELTLRGAMLDMPKEKLPTRAGVFDFSFAERVNADLATKGWKPNP
jgi:hypothetical protein